MKCYLLGSRNRVFRIEADCLEIYADRLDFIFDRTVIASFRHYDYFHEEGKVEKVETEKD